MLSDNTLVTNGVEVDEEETFRCRANDVLAISFYDNANSGECHKHFSPLFTHQIFEEESIPLSSPNTVKIEINVGLDLSSTLDVTQCTAEDDEAYIRHKLSNVAPVSAEPVCNFAEPIGTKLKTLCIGDDQFELYLATHTDAGASALLRRAEKIAILFIETADSVDFSDDRWEILWIYTTHIDTITGVKSTVVAGYMTLFTFFNPFGELPR
jgi:hypothetical protein